MLRELYRYAYSAGIPETAGKQRPRQIGGHPVGKHCGYRHGDARKDQARDRHHRGQGTAPLIVHAGQKARRMMLDAQMGKKTARS